jgi:hypothetical protein
VRLTVGGKPLGDELTAYLPMIEPVGHNLQPFFLDTQSQSLYIFYGGKASSYQISIVD